MAKMLMPWLQQQNTANGEYDDGGDDDDDDDEILEGNEFYSNENRQ